MSTPQLDHILQRMTKALEEKTARLYGLNEELIELAPKYERFLEVARQMEREQYLVNKLRVALADSNKRDASGNEVSGYSFWEMIEVYLRFVREAQVEDIAKYLEWIGFTAHLQTRKSKRLAKSSIGGVRIWNSADNWRAARQAIESAINTHLERFKVEKRGRSKFVSLREDFDPKTALKK